MRRRRSHEVSGRIQSVWRDALLSLAGASLLVMGCQRSHPGVAPETSGGTLRPYTGKLEPDDGQWVRATKDFANTHYSSLDQINTQNVAQLRPAWTFSTGV